MTFDLRSAIRGFGKWIGLNSLAGTFVVAGSALLGMLLTLFLPEIRRAFPIPLLEGETSFTGPIVKSAVAFWVLFFLVVIVAWLKEKYRAKETEDLHQELNESIEDLKQITLTMPPKDYLERYADQYKKVVNFADLVFFSARRDFEEAMPQDEADELRYMTDEAIRAMLDSILNLAKVFDAPHTSSHPRYSAEIAWLIPPSELDDENLDILWNLAAPLTRHSNVKPFLASAENLLVHDVNLTTTHDNDATIDEYAEPWVMGLELGSGPNEDPNLPGPLHAIKHSRYDLVPDTLALSKRLVDFGNSARERVHHYYMRQPFRRSSLSMALRGVSPNDPEGDPKPIAILTLYRDSPDIMGSVNRADMFVHQITPFLSPVFRLCWSRMLLDYRDGRSLELYTNIMESPIGEEGDDYEQNSEASR